MEFSLRLHKSWDTHVEMVQAFIPGVIKTF